MYIGYLSLVKLKIYVEQIQTVAKLLFCYSVNTMFKIASLLVFRFVLLIIQWKSRHTVPMTIKKHCPSFSTFRPLQ